MKNAGQTIPERIYAEIAAAIANGDLKAGEMLPGDRILAQRYQVGRSSMISALKMLETNGFIERLPMRGTVIRNDAKKVLSEVRIFCPLPELPMSPDSLGYANLIANAEFERGITAGAIENNCTVIFHHMTDSFASDVLRRQIDFIQKDCHAVVFLGHQFAHLKLLVQQQQIPAVTIFPQVAWGSENIPGIDYDEARSLDSYAQYLHDAGCRKFMFLYLESRDLPDLQELMVRMSIGEQALKRRGIEVGYHKLPFHLRPSEELAQLGREWLASLAEPPDTLCVPHFQLLQVLQTLPEARQMRLCGYTGVGLFSTLYPEVLYLRVPCFSMGLLAQQLLVEAVRNNRSQVTLPEKLCGELWCGTSLIKEI